MQKYIQKRLLIWARSIAKKQGFAIVPQAHSVDIFLHEYESYEQYRDVQIHHNKRKIKNIFADEATMARVAETMLARVPEGKISGLCHGTRNGFEQSWLNDSNPRFDVLGTDISETATDFPNSTQWDFHDRREDWSASFDFVYSNSLDQAWKPRMALETWLDQLKPGGAVIIEHTESHGPERAGEMDPFGVRPTAMPYVLTDWFGDQITITHSVAQKANMDKNAWLFVVTKLSGATD